MSTRKTTKTPFIVRGRGPLPFDMLRYDQAWPASEHDAHRCDTLDNDRRAITLVTANASLTPNAARWSSFGWEVVAVGDSHVRQYLEMHRNDKD